MELCSQFHARTYLTPKKKHVMMYGIGGWMVPRTSQNFKHMVPCIMIQY